MKRVLLVGEDGRYVVVEHGDNLHVSISDLEPVSLTNAALDEAQQMAKDNPDTARYDKENDQITLST